MATMATMRALGARGKQMSALFGVRETVLELPAEYLELQLLSVEIRDADTLGAGTEQYAHEEHRRDEPVPEAPSDDDGCDAALFTRGKDDSSSEEEVRAPASSAPSHVYLSCADEHGRTVAVRVRDARFALYVQCPDAWNDAHMQQLVGALNRRYRVAPRDAISYVRTAQKHFCYYTPDPADPSRPRPYNYCKLLLPGAVLLRRVTWLLRNGGLAGAPRADPPLQVHESRIACEHKLLDALELEPSGWFRAQPYTLPERYYTHAQIEVECAFAALRPLPTRTDTAPLWEACFDIECLSADGSFPDARNAADSLICINTYAAQRGSTAAPIQTCHYLGEAHAPDGVQVYCCANERQLLDRWRDLVVLDLQPHVLMGYNVNGFDYEYMAVKAGAERHVEPGTDGRPPRVTWSCTASRFFRQSLFVEERTPLLERDLSSAAKGENVHRYMAMPGRLSIDMFHWVKDGMKLVSYALKDVCEQVFRDRRTGDTPAHLRKVDLTPQRLWALHRTGDAAQRSEIIAYAARDCQLPAALAARLQVLPNLVQMSRVTRTPLTQILIRGQQIKCWNQIVYYCHRMGYVVNLDGADKPAADDSDDDEDGYEGAIVLEPLAGYYQTPITVLDFESLYPSIMQAHNLCMSSLVRDAAYKNLDAPVRYGRYVPRAGKCNTFVQHFRGVLPCILDTLKATRAAVRHEQKQYAKGSAAWLVCEGRQLAIKVTANSVYGFFGAARRGIMPCVEISETVTLIGREMITRTREWIQTEHAAYLQDYTDAAGALVDLSEARALVRGAQVIYGGTFFFYYSSSSI